MNIIIAGDLVSNNSNIELFGKKYIDEILGNGLLQKWENAEYKIFNLEAPLTNASNSIKKDGPSLKNDSAIILGIKAMNPTCIMLANNHIMDYGDVGLKDTINELDKNGISWIGVGNNKKELSKSYIINSKIAIYNCCETEFSNAKYNKCGANYYDEFEIQKDLKDLKEKCEYIIVVYHGGKEYYRYPSPMLQKRCRQMIDYGANLVTCQHSHCSGCKEEYNKGTIVYGQGNFIFNKRSNEFWNTSILLDLNLDDYSINYIPIERTDIGTKLAEGDVRDKVLQGFEDRSEQIKQEGFVEEEYKKFANEMIFNYIYTARNYGLLMKVLKKLFPKLAKKIVLKKNKNIYTLLNYIRCEAHRELFVQGLENIIE